MERGQHFVVFLSMHWCLGDVRSKDVDACRVEQQSTQACENVLEQVPQVEAEVNRAPAQIPGRWLITRMQILRSDGDFKIAHVFSHCLGRKLTR